MSDAAAERKRIAEMLERNAVLHDATEARFLNEEFSDMNAREWLAYVHRRIASELRGIAKGLKEIDKED